MLTICTKRAVLVVAVLLAGCAQNIQPDTSRLTRPKAAWMERPAPLAVIKEGDDSFRSDGQCSAAYVEVSQRLTALQGWAATVLKK